jgi:uncharacterized protein
MTAELTVEDNAEKRRYEGRVADELAGYIAYYHEPGRMMLLHTEVLPEFEGQGVGSRLVGRALADIRERGLSLVPACPFVRGYLERHPEDADLVTK